MHGFKKKHDFKKKLQFLRCRLSVQCSLFRVFFSSDFFTTLFFFDIVCCCLQSEWSGLEVASPIKMSLHHLYSIVQYSIMYL